MKPRFVAAVVAVIAAGLSGCAKPPPPAEDVRPVRTIVAQPGPAELNNVFAGEVRPRYQSDLGFRVAGKIAARLVNVGDTVKTGQVLARLDPKDLSLNEASSRANVAAQEAQFEVERVDLERYRKLLDQGFVSKAEFDRQQTRFKAAEAQLEAVRAQARVSANQTGYAELKADHDGTVVSVEAEAGQVVAAGQVVVRLAQAGEIEIATDVPEQLVRDLQVGQPVQVSLWTAGAQMFPGRVRELSSSAAAATRTYALRVTVEKPPAAMRLGMTASVRIPRHGVPELIHVPISSWVEQGGRQGVWVFDAAAGVVRFREAQVAAFSANEALLAGGVQPGEHIVTAGARMLAEGQRVRPLDGPVAN